MKGNEKLIDMLNEALTDELTAIMQYTVHAEMCANWGYERLHKKIEGRARQEMKHAERLIERVIFLEGIPKVDTLNKIHIGPEVAKQFASDLKAEQGAVRMYNEAIHLADKVGDAATRTLLEEILRDEDDHVDWLEEQQDQIQQMGIELYLSVQTEE